ncbi:MAG: protein kinase [Chloroflexota bacterium]
MYAQANNRYHYIAPLGAGSMGEVYKAHDRLTNTQVALKCVTLPGLGSYNDATTQQAHTVALVNEFRMLASLRHPYIISVLDYGLDISQQPFFTMDLLTQKQTFTDATRDISTAQFITYTIQLLQAMAYLHQRGIVHRDVKPANILVTAGQVRVLDFGLSITLQDDQQRVGTLRYMAPETIAQGKATQASDLYSIGAMLYEAITGEMPYDVFDFHVRTRYVSDLSAIADHPLALIIERLLQIMPEDRYPSARAVIDAISRVSERKVPTETQAIRDSFIQTAPFVGRVPELDQLKTALALAQTEQQNQLMLIGGESGVGKSRLVDELRIHALVSGIDVLRGQAINEAVQSYAVWRPIVRRLLLSGDVSASDASILKDLVPDIDSLLNQKVDPAPQIHGQAYQQRLAVTIEKLISVQERPLLLILEDMQWSDPTFALLKHLVQRLDALPPLLIVCTYRDDDRPELPELFPSATHLALKRLDEPAISALSEAMLGDAGAQSQVIDLLKRETGGNVFFMVEVVRALAEDAGNLASIGSRTLPESVFTGNMQAILQRRLSKLPDEMRPLLEFAAVAGKQIEPELLTNIAPQSDVDEWLYTCEQLAIITTQDNQWLFVHDKLRETVFVDIQPDRLQGIHAQVAQAIEKLYPDNPIQYPTLLEHWYRAENLAKSLHYLVPVVEDLIRIKGEYAHAKELLQHAMRRLASDDPHRHHLLNYLAESDYEIGKIDTAQTYAQEALTLAITHSDITAQAHSYLILGHAARIRDEYSRSLECYQHSFDLFLQADKPADAALSQFMLGNTYSRKGTYDLAEQAYIASLARFRTLDHLRGIGICLEDLGMIARIKKDLPTAYHYAHESLAISRQLGDQRGIALKLNSLGRVLRDDKRYNDAEETLRESLMLLENLGDIFGSAWSRYQLALILYVQGHHADARQLNAKSLTTYRGLSDRYGMSLCETAHGFLDILDNDLDSARAHFNEAMHQAQVATVTPLGLMGMVGCAVIAHRKGDIASARQLLHLAHMHPNTNTEVFFRLNTLPADVAPLYEVIVAEDNPLTDPDVEYTSTLETLLAKL